MRAPTTPSSLKWLINRHARIQGEIKKFERAEAQRRSGAAVEIAKLHAAVQTARYAENANRLAHDRLLEALTVEMEAVELLLGRHEIPIDPVIIRPIRSSENLSPVEFGTYTRLIYECLRLANGKPCTATQVAIHITVRLEWALNQKTFADFRYQIRQRMKHLAWEGKISRVPNQVDRLEGRWCLLPEDTSTGLAHTRLDGDALESNPSTTETSRS